MMDNPIIIPKPCHENWDAMTPNEQGRFCNTCAKTVVDATALTNEEIWIKHQQNDNSLCVHIPTERVTVLPKTRFQQLKVASIAALLAFWLSVKQAVLAQTDSTNNTKNKVPNDSSQAIQKIVINGIVSDSIERLNGLAFCNITVLQNNKVVGGGISNYEGKFTITLIGQFTLLDKLTLKCATVGYANIETVFTPKDTIQCDIYMNESHICLNEAIITARRNSYIVGKLPMTNGVMVSRKSGKIVRKIMDNYDTKTYYSDEIERYNLGR